MNAKQRIDDALSRFAKLHHQNIDLGLERLRVLLAKLGNPHLSLPPVIHVAGTNGKGSTIAMLRAMAQGQGLCTHVHTSPHLIDLNERFVLSGKQITDANLADLLEQVEHANDGACATVFELLSAAMFVVFAANPADLAIIEVGLGGELDATNILEEPALSLITAIGIDHSDWLGTDIADIAGAKAGIIKPGCPAISARQPDIAREVIENAAQRNRCSLEFIGEEIQCFEEYGRLLWQNEQQLLDLPLPALPGDWQIQNAGLAIAAAVKLGWSEHAIAYGLQQVNWPGRLQRIKAFAPLGNDAEVWLDGAHNPDAARALSAFFAVQNKVNSKPLHLVLALQATKDVTGFIEQFLPLNPELHIVPLDEAPAPLSTETLAVQCRQVGFRATAYSGLQEAFEQIPAIGSRVLITGSLILVGMVLCESKKKRPSL